MSAGELSLETLNWACLQVVPQLRDVDLLQCTQDQQKVDDRNGPLGALPGKVGWPRAPHFMKGGKGREGIGREGRGGEGRKVMGGGRK